MTKPSAPETLDDPSLPTSAPAAQESFEASFGRAAEQLEAGAGVGMGVAMANLKRQLFGRAELPRVGERYELQRVLGRGGLGVVYQAHDRELEREVAVKLVRPTRASPGASDRLIREARMLAKVEHPNVVRIYDAGRVENSGTEGAAEVFIVMELLAGEPLADWLEGDHDWAQRLERFVEAGRGLQAAHAAGVVHRDFKPQNVVIGTDGRARVVDFGLAFSGRDGDERSANGEEVEHLLTDGRLTRDGTVLGTLDYMPPEQREGGSTVDARSDQYAFCSSAAEALGLERPGQETGVASGVPREVARVIQRGLERDKAKRWPDMGVLLDSLEGAGKARRRKRLVAGAGAVLLSVAAAAWWAGERAAVDCSMAREELTRVWSPAHRDALADALGSVEERWASWTRERTLSDFDSYAQRWLAVREQQCRAPRAAEIEVRARCVSDALVAFETGVALLSEGDSGVAREAAQIVSELPVVEACLDQRVEQLLTVAGREDPTGTLGVSRRLVRIAALRQGGQYEQAVTEAQALLDWASAEGLQATRAGAHFELGMLAQRQRDPQRAPELLDLAYDEALAAGVDNLVAQISAVRVGGDFDSPADLDRLSARAEAWLERTHATTQHWASFYNQRGVGLLELRRWAEAEQSFARSIELYESDPRTPARRVLVPRHNAAVLPLMAGGQMGEDELHALADIVTRRREVLGPEHPLTQSARVNLATIRMGVGDFEGARAEFDGLFGELSDSGRADSAIANAVRVNLAQTELAAHHPERVLQIVGPKYERFIGGGESAGPTSVRNGGLIVTSLARAYVQLGELERGRAVLAKLEQVLTDADAPTRKAVAETVSFVWSERAWLELVAQDHALAESFARRALAGRAGEPPLSPERHKRTLHALAIARVRQGDAAGAREEFRRASEGSYQTLDVSRAAMILGALQDSFGPQLDDALRQRLTRAGEDLTQALAGPKLRAWQAVVDAVVSSSAL